MNELKAYRFLGQDEVWPGANLGSDYYLKSEADKVIAEKDKTIAELLAEVEDVTNTYKASVENKVKIWECCKKAEADTAEKDKEISHHKYKRCLDVSRWCDTKADWYYSLGESFRNRVDFYIKWRDKWLELAEKFKPNSTAQ